MYNTNLGVGIRLLMPKSKIDKILGEPSYTADHFEYGYGEDWISITYLDGKAVYIYSYEKNWVVHKGIGLGSTLDETIQAFGENRFTEGSTPAFFYLYDKNKNSLKSKKDIDFVVWLKFDDYDGILTNVAILTYDYLKILQ
ncbi:hypothetical protein SDC9_117059 [bioreactor metagenome]|uniref:Uncharacterized protein n=1 Tax=bioreactor metagenome TaxID=1076179 RepID=A0A645BY48_9ZZZZ